MKKFNTLLITLALMLLSATTIFAWDIKNPELGVSFTISNNWTETEFTGYTLSFKNTNDSNEHIFIGSTDIGYTSNLSYSNFLEICNQHYSNSELSSTLVNHETGLPYYPKITQLNIRHESVTYNGIEYFNYVKEYEASKSGYITGYGLISTFLTIQNGKVYEITYNLYENYQETLGSNYYTSEIFNILNSLSYDPGAIKITINGERIYTDSAPIIVYDRTMVPIRAVAEALGYNVNWDPYQQVVSMFPTVKNMPILQVEIGYPYLIKNNAETIPLEVKPFILNGRTYLPLRAISENMNAKVSWDRTSKTVIITK